MYFLPEEELEVTWIRHRERGIIEGHAWYGDSFCFFECEERLKESTEQDCCIFKLYALSGRALISEMACERLSELAKGPRRFCRLARTLIPARNDSPPGEVSFVGRFIGLPPQGQGQSSASRLRRTRDRIADTIPQRFRNMFSGASLLSQGRSKRVA
jgi:hypothetical protein